MKILLAVDGSKCSETAIEALIKQYKAEGTEVLVTNVVESVRLMPITYGFAAGPVFVQDYEKIAREWREQGEALVTRVVEQLRKAAFKATPSLVEGDARERILEAAKTWKPDLIVMGSHGWRGLDRFLLGSVSDAIARHAPCSVEIVRDTTAA